MAELKNMYDVAREQWESGGFSGWDDLAAWTQAQINKALEHAVQLIDEHRCSYDCCDDDGNPLGCCKYAIANAVKVLVGLADDPQPYHTED